jgi:hypothetical protein
MQASSPVTAVPKFIDRINAADVDPRTWAIGVSSELFAAS